MAPRSKPPKKEEPLPKAGQAGKRKASAPASIGADANPQRMKMFSLMSDMKEPDGTIIGNDFIEPCHPGPSIVIDHVLGIDGLHMHGRIYQIHGEEHSGKSTIMYCSGGAYQRATGAPVMVWDFEGQLATPYLWQCGMNPDPTMTYLRQPSDLNEVLRITTELIVSDACKFFVFDSVTMMLPGVSLDEIRAGKALAPPPGEQARAFKRFLQILQPRARAHDAILCFVNQECTKIATDFKSQQESKYQTIAKPFYNLNGGKAARYFPSITLETSKSSPSKGSMDDKTVWLFPGAEKVLQGSAETWTFNKTGIRSMKNKVTAAGYRKYHLWIRPGGGIDDWISVRELAREHNLIEYKGGKWRIGTEAEPITTFSNRESALNAIVINQDPAILFPLREQVVQAVKNADPRMYAYERSARDRFIAGDTDEVPVGTVVNYEDDEIATLGGPLDIGEDDL